jgi:hypothetical protein
MIHLDIQYVRHRNFWLDAKLIFLTIPALFMQIRALRMAKIQSQQLANSDRSNREDTEGETLRKLLPI